MRRVVESDIGIGKTGAEYWIVSESVTGPEI
jgi:hypothetical protein